MNILVSLIASSSRRRMLRRLSASTPTIKRAAGAILAGFGTILIVLTAWPGLLAPLFP